MAESSSQPVVNHSSPRRPLTLDDKFARISNKVTGAESDHRIAFGESHRISNQNQLRRSCIESSTVPVYTSFSRDSPAYNLTVNFENQSGRRHDDPRFRMYKAMIKHPDAFELPEREIHRRKLLEEIEVLATKQNVEINFDDGVPKISPRQTKMVISPRGSPAREENSWGNGSAAKHSQKKNRSEKALASSDPARQDEEEGLQGEQMNSRRENEKETFVVPTFIASEFRKSIQEGDEGEVNFPSSASASASDGGEKESKKLITFQNPKISTPTRKERLGSKKAKTTCSYHVAGDDDKKAVADRMPEIITPRVVHPRARIEEMLRARETIIGEVMGATSNNGNSGNHQSNTTNNIQNTTQRFSAPPFSVAALTSTTPLSSPPSASAILLASGPQPTNNHNTANPLTPSMSLSQGFGFDSSVSKSTFSTSNPHPPSPAAAATVVARSAAIPQPPPANSARRQSLAIPVILGGGPEVLTDAAKLIAKRQQRDSLRKERGEGTGHRHKNKKNNGAGNSLSPKTLRASGKHGNNNSPSSSPRKKRSTLLEEDSVDSHSSERFDDIPLFDDQNDARSSSCGRSVGDNDSNVSSDSDYSGSDDDSDSEYGSSDEESLESGATAVGGGDAHAPPLHLLKRCKPPKQRSSKKKSKRARNGGKRGNPGKASLLTSQPTLEGSPVAVARSFHLKVATKPQAPKPPMEASGRGRGNGAKSQQRGAHGSLELLDETTMGRPDTLDNKNGEANSGLSRAGSGITLAIPSSPRHYENKDFASSTPLAPMPAPQRGVVGASMLTVRDQIIRSIGGGGGGGAAQQSDGKLGSSNSINTAEVASASISLASPGASNRQMIMNHSPSFNMGKSGGGASATTTTATISSNWCLTQPKQEVSRESTQTAVVSALSTPRAVRDLFVSSAQIGGGGATVGGSTTLTPGGIGGAASARASFYQNGTLSFANMKRQQQSFAGFGASTSRKASTMLGFHSTYNTMLSSNFGSTYGGMGGGGGSDRGSNFNYDGSSSEFVDRERGAESALIHVMPPVVFRGLTSSGAGTIQPRRKRAMAVNYGPSSAGPQKATDHTQRAEEKLVTVALKPSENNNYDQRAPPPAYQPDLMQTIAGTKALKNPSCGRGRPADGSLSSRI